jgi:hypothetical protein
MVPAVGVPETLLRLWSPRSSFFPLRRRNRTTTRTINSSKQHRPMPSPTHGQKLASSSGATLPSADADVGDSETRGAVDVASLAAASVTLIADGEFVGVVPEETSDPEVSPGHVPNAAILGISVQEKPGTRQIVPQKRQLFATHPEHMPLNIMHGSGVGVGVGAGVGDGVGSGVGGLGVGCGVGCSVAPGGNGDGAGVGGTGVGAGEGAGVGFGVGRGDGRGVGTGDGAGVATVATCVGAGVGRGVGLGVGAGLGKGRRVVGLGVVGVNTTSTQK